MRQGPLSAHSVQPLCSLATRCRDAPMNPANETGHFTNNFPNRATRDGGREGGDVLKSRSSRLEIWYLLTMSKVDVVNLFGN